jgi:predicted extracellular nuclease
VLGDTSGDSDIRSALLIDSRLAVTARESLFAREARAGKPLHDRQPLRVDVDAGQHGRLTVVVVHMKSMRGLNSARDGDRIADKRRFQAVELGTWARAQIKAGRRLVVLGDFNATIIDSDLQRSEPMQLLLSESGLSDVASRFLKPTQRWTYKYQCALNELDHVLISPVLAESVTGYAISRGDTCIRVKEKCDVTRSVSDHDGVVLRLRPERKP